MRLTLFLIVLFATCNGCEPEAPRQRERTLLPDAGPSPSSVGGLSESKSLLRGEIKLVGEVPAPRRPFVCPSCKKPAFSEDCVLDQDNHLRWAFVYVKRGLEGRTFDALKEPQVITVGNHRFWPHTLGVRVDQDIKIVNSQDHFYSVHAYPIKNKDFLSGLPTKGQDIVRRFHNPEIMIKIWDDVHPWMAGWIGVLDHPYFAVTGADGRFEIRGLPPGRYVLEAWQERCSQVEHEIEMKGDEPLTTNFDLPLRKE